MLRGLGKTGKLAGAMLGLLLLAAGCRHHRAHRSTSGFVELRADELPAVQRTSLEVHWQKFPDLTHLQLPGRDNYRGLGEKECQCLAAANSKQAALLENENALCRKSDLVATILAYGALEARNQSAGGALELYYRLAEAEAKWDLVETSLQHIGRMLAEEKNLKAQGLKVPPEFETFKTQQQELLADRDRLHFSIEQLNQELSRLVGISLSPGGRFWPTTDFAIVPLVVNTDEAIGIAFGQRPQLVLLEQAGGNVTRSSLPVLRRILQSSNGLLALSDAGGSSMTRLLAIVAAGRELPVRKDQIDVLRVERQEEVANEVVQAARNMEKQLHLISRAHDRVIYWQEKVNDLEGRQAKGNISILEVAPAQLSWLKARSELASEVMAWHIARVKLRQAQGVLVAECSP